MERLTMKERRVMVKAFAGQYRKVTKKEKGTILDRFMEATGYQRHYAARLLRNQGRRVRFGPRVVFKAEVGVASGAAGALRAGGWRRRCRGLWRLWSGTGNWR